MRYAALVVAAIGIFTMAAMAVGYRFAYLRCAAALSKIAWMCGQFDPPPYPTIGKVARIALLEIEGDDDGDSST